MVDEVVVAYHEAGHALLAESVGASVLVITIVPVDDEGPRRHGETTIAWKPSGSNPEQLAIQQAKVALAGPVAEMIYCDEQYEIEVIQEWWADWLIAISSVKSLPGVNSTSGVNSMIARLCQETIRWMSQDAIWDRIARLADQLEAHETLESDQLDELRAWGVL